MVLEVIQIKTYINKCTDWVNKLNQFFQSWIRKPILDIYKCPKRESGSRIGPKTSLFSLSKHNALIFKIIRKSVLR